MKKLTLLVVLSVCLGNCGTALFTGKKIDSRWGRNRNACKTLTGNTLIYAIFIDAKGPKPWTGFDIRSTMDSLRMAAHWMEAQAKGNNIGLNVQVAAFSSPKAKTISLELPKKTLYESLDDAKVSGALKKINRWAANASKKTLVHFPSMPNGPKKTTDRLVEQLRNKYNCENVILLFMLNNYYKDDASCTVNIMTDEDAEYGICSTKNPSLIAHLALNLAGANSLNEEQIRVRFRYQDFVKKEFPDDVMVSPRKHISQLEIGPFTQYMIGWTDELDPRYEKLLWIDKRGKKVKRRED